MSSQSGKRNEMRRKKRGKKSAEEKGGREREERGGQKQRKIEGNRKDEKDELNYSQVSKANKDPPTMLPLLGS